MQCSESAVSFKAEAESDDTPFTGLEIKAVEKRKSNFLEYNNNCQLATGSQWRSS